MRQKLIKIFGVGINDSETPVVKHSVTSGGNREGRRIIWACPHYKMWANMLARGFDSKRKELQPTYKDVTVCNEWLSFVSFRTWVESQQWEGMYLDKDILIPGNKIYSPESCAFVSRQLNNFVTERGNHRGEYKIGVYLQKDSGWFRAACNNPFTQEKEFLGRFETEQEAHAAWLEKKLSHAKSLASMINDKRLATALVSRYENYNATVS